VSALHFCGNVAAASHHTAHGTYTDSDESTSTKY